MVTGHVSAVVVLPEFDVTAGDVRLEDFIGFFVVERIEVRGAIAKDGRPGRHGMFGYFHVRAKLLGVEEKGAVLAGVETVGDGDEEFLVEFEGRWKLEETGVKELIGGRGETNLLQDLKGAIEKLKEDGRAFGVALVAMANALSRRID